MSEQAKPDAAPGWYPDPDQARTLRYWDGSKWISRRALIETSAANDRRARPNSLERRERTRKEGKCQLCETKVSLSDQYTVTNDLENGTVNKRKNAARKGAETASHYCGDCAEKRVKQKGDWLAQRDGTAKPKKGKAKAAKKGKAKASSGNAA